MSLQSRIADLLNGPMKHQGWCSPQAGNDLAMAVIKTKASVVCEIGTFYGASLIPMAMACAEQNHGICWAIDPWSREASVEGYDDVNAKWWGSVDHESVYQTFLMHLRVQGLERFVKVIREKSDNVEPPDEIDVLNIDGQHTDQAIRDVERFASKVRLNCFCHIDDVEWSSGGPRRAVEKLLTMGFVEVFKRDTGAMFQRTEKKAVFIPAKVKKKGGRPKGSKNKKGAKK